MTKQQEFDEIMRDYIPELHRTLGSVKTQQWFVYYLKGWVYIEFRPSGSVAKRRIAQFRDMLNELKKRPDVKREPWVASN